MRVLLLAGTAEAVQIGQALAREDRVSAVASVTGGERVPAPTGIPTRIGGWDDYADFADWLAQGRISAILDASDPFDASISHQAAAAAHALDIPHVMFLRPAWTPGDGDRWTFLNDEADTARHAPVGAPILLDTGMRGLGRFGDLGDRVVWVGVEHLNGDRFPFSRGGFVRRPASRAVPRQVASLRALDIDWMVVRNIGGTQDAGLLEAARQLGLHVGMIRRPPQPDSLRIHSVAEALAWVRRRM